MNNTENLKVTFDRTASLSVGKVVNRGGIPIRVSRVSATKVSGHTRVDFESERRKDAYRKINQVLEKG